MLHERIWTHSLRFDEIFSKVFKSEDDQIQILNLVVEIRLCLLQLLRFWGFQMPNELRRKWRNGYGSANGWTCGRIGEALFVGKREEGRDSKECCVNRVMIIYASTDQWTDTVLRQKRKRQGKITCRHTGLNCYFRLARDPSLALRGLQLAFWGLKTPFLSPKLGPQHSSCHSVMGFVISHHAMYLNNHLGEIKGDNCIHKGVFEVEPNVTILWHDQLKRLVIPWKQGEKEFL